MGLVSLFYNYPFPIPEKSNKDSLKLNPNQVVEQELETAETEIPDKNLQDSPEERTE